MVWFSGDAMWSQEVDLMILVNPFQLEIFHDSMNFGPFKHNLVSRFLSFSWLILIIFSLLQISFPYLWCRTVKNIWVFILGLFFRVSLSMQNSPTSAELLSVALCITYSSWSFSFHIASSLRQRLLHSLHLGSTCCICSLPFFKIQKNPRHLRQAAEIHAHMSASYWQLQFKTSQVDWKLARWQLLQAKRINYLGIMPGEQAWWMQYIIPCHDCVSSGKWGAAWDSTAAIFALSGEATILSIRLRRQKKPKKNNQTNKKTLIFSLKLYVWTDI